MEQGWIVSESVARLNCQSQSSGKTRPLDPTRRWFQHRCQKRGEGVGYSGHKHQRGEKILTIVDNHGHIVAPIVVRSVNVHDTVLFPESFDGLLETADMLSLDIRGSAVTLDSGFDSETNQELIRSYGLIPVIKPNHRGTKNTEKREERDEAFQEVEEMYKERHNVERSYAWEDTYRKLVIRYEKLQCTFLGFRYLAYSMMNFRESFQRM